MVGNKAAGVDLVIHLICWRLNLCRVFVHLLIINRCGLSQRRVAGSWRLWLLDECVGRAGHWEQARSTEGRRWHDNDKRARLLVVKEVYGPSKLSGENECYDEIDIARLARLQDPYQFFLEAKLFNLQALLCGILVAAILHRDREVRALSLGLSRGYNFDGGTHRACHSRSKQIQDHLPEHEVARTNHLRCCGVDPRRQRNIPLFEIVLRYTLDLFENVAHFEVGGSLRESTLADIVDLLEVQDPMEDALRLVESLVGDLAALFIQMVIQLL